MNSMLLVNESEVEAVLSAAPTEIVRNLARMGVAVARMRYARRKDQTEAEWRAGLPAAPFDMRFYASVLVSLFSQTKTIENVLQGQSIADASGWSWGGPSEVRALPAAEADEVRRRMAARLELPPDGDPLVLVRRLLEAETWVRGFDATQETFHLDEVFRVVGIEPPPQVLVNWYRFDRIDQFQLADLIAYFGDIWQPSTDDIDIFDESCAWVVSVLHSGEVEAVRFSRYQVGRVSAEGP